MPVENDLVLKPISELLDESFFIPAYQRGYRWTKRQVTELLDDIKEFQQQAEEGPKRAFYCLQPIVVKRRGDSWELVDGQQRLTTIFIILTYLKDILALLGKSRYQLSYETREDSAEFLKNIDESRGEENIDFYHIVEAKRAVDEWFKRQDGAYQIKFIQTLLNDDETGKNVKVIWYQISDSDDVTDVFTRLNMGKIPLVNAELVKALFLKSNHFDKDGSVAKHLQQLNISQEWDAIEKRLQDDAFWFFLSNKNIKTNRIEFVLKLAARELDSEGILDSDKLKVFLQFNRLLSPNEGKADVVKEWLKIKQCYMTLEEWFNDRALFHLVGYLVSQGVELEKLFVLNEESKTKFEFRQALIEWAFKQIFITKELSDNSKEFLQDQLDALSYDSGARKVRSLLLLFNVASLLANPVTNARFQFDKFKQDCWDIEHIRSVASEMPSSRDKQLDWLQNVVNYISEDRVVDEEATEKRLSKIQLIRNHASELLNASSFDIDQFSTTYEQVIEVFDSGDGDIDDSIGNLTLLDSSTNRSYKNAVFPIKRSRIIALDKQATFVPLCTKNVFLKYYSKRVDKMLFWGAKDSQDHQQAMVDILFDFFCGRGVH
ncbi:DUF262 domain-containing protein [Vibrio vulnificus]|uniref:DUF262 domain-containing protein n=1 Tax=Vibrio vulnificus TaxID=672 RepID=UPI001CDC5306|nr:DUF262 domain-containing protein [Vibrio vulnificus]MCA4023332.1 DUF262 domain-containing protein [Vibrio vulnificus]